MQFFRALIFVFTNKETKLKAFAYSLILFVLFGIPTALLSSTSSPYSRMIPAVPLDYVFLFTTSVLAGAYLALPLPASCHAPTKTALGGGVLGFLAFSCPTCNKLLVLLLSFTFMYEIVNPLRPFIGAASVIALSYSLAKKFESTQAQNSQPAKP